MQHYMGGKNCKYVHTHCNVILLAYFLDPLNPPTFMITEMSTSLAKVMYCINRMNLEMGPLIAGYEVSRFGVPMIGEYMNVGTRKTAIISPVVPGTNYRIEAWALSNGRRNAAPAVKNVETKEAGKVISSNTLQ